MVQVQGLPEAGRAIDVRLWYQTPEGAWLFRDCKINEAPASNQVNLTGTFSETDNSSCSGTGLLAGIACSTCTSSGDFSAVVSQTPVMPPPSILPDLTGDWVVTTTNGTAACGNGTTPQIPVSDQANALSGVFDKPRNPFVFDTCSAAGTVIQHGLSVFSSSNNNQNQSCTNCHSLSETNLPATDFGNLIIANDVTNFVSDVQNGAEGGSMPAFSSIATSDVQAIFVYLESAYQQSLGHGSTPIVCNQSGCTFACAGLTCSIQCNPATSNCVDQLSLSGNEGTNSVTFQVLENATAQINCGQPLGTSNLTHQSTNAFTGTVVSP
jgi:hypothetical protein